MSYTSEFLFVRPEITFPVTKNALPIERFPQYQVMNPATSAINSTARVQAVSPAPGARETYPDVLFICGDDLRPHESDREDYLRRASDAYGVTSEFVTPETSGGRTVFAMLDDLHAKNSVGPSTCTVIIMHGTNQQGHHMMQFSRDQPLVSTMAFLEHIAKLDSGGEASADRRCVLHSCAVNIIAQAVKEMSGNYFLIGGKNSNLLEPALDAITEMLRQMGAAKRQPRGIGTAMLTAEQTFGYLAAAVGATVTHTGNGQLAQSRARTHADFNNKAIKRFEPSKEKRAADAILHLLVKKNDDKLKRLLDEVPAARDILKRPGSNWMQVALERGTTRQIRLLMSHGMPGPAPAAFLKHLAASGIENADDDVGFMLDAMMKALESSPRAFVLPLRQVHPEIRVQWLGESIAQNLIAQCAPAGAYESDLALLGIICGFKAHSYAADAKAFRLLVDYACQWLQERAAGWNAPCNGTGFRTACFNAQASRLPRPFRLALLACRDQLLAQRENENAVLAATGRILAAEALRSSREAEMDTGYDPKNRTEHQAGHWLALPGYQSWLAAALQDVRAASDLQTDAQ